MAYVFCFKVTLDMYLMNAEENALEPDCDMGCRTLNMRGMYQDTFAIVTGRCS